MEAARKCHVTVVETLLISGAKKDVKDKVCTTLLFLHALSVLTVMESFLSGWLGSSRLCGDY